MSEEIRGYLNVANNKELSDQVADRLNELRLPASQEKAFVQGVGRFLMGEAILVVRDKGNVMDVNFVPARKSDESDQSDKSDKSD